MLYIGHTGRLKGPTEATKTQRERYEAPDSHAVCVEIAAESEEVPVKHAPDTPIQVL